MSNLVETSKHEDLIYDVGLHVGEHTEFCLKKRFRVIGFQANPGLAEQCKERFSQYIASGHPCPTHYSVFVRC